MVTDNLASAVVAALVSAGAAAAMAAAKRSGEIRDAVLRLSGKFEALDARLALHMADVRSQHAMIDRDLERLESRVRGLEVSSIRNGSYREPASGRPLPLPPPLPLSAYPESPPEDEEG